jgi:glycosyltransferase involved in cell wall biosynthesis
MPTPAPSQPIRQPTKVMVFLNSFNPGGVERVALRLCGAWATDPTLDVRLVIGRDEGVMRAEAPPGLALHGMAAPRGLAARAPSVWMFILLFREVRRQRPDVLFAAGNTYAVFAVAMKLLLGRDCPPVVLKISNDLERRDMAPLFRRGYRLWLRIQGRMIDHLVGLAAPMHAEIMDAMRVPADRVHVIDDPALSLGDIAALEKLGDARLPGPARRYVAVGRLAGQKNFPLLLDAFALAAQPGDRLTIIGEGVERARLAAHIAALGLAQSVDLPGHTAVEPALAAADVFVLSSDFEALPAAIVEALASGLPVVATDCCVSMRALVGDFGSIVPRRDAAALAAAMRAQPPLAAGLRHAAAREMRAFTVERAAGKYRNLFTAVYRDPVPKMPYWPDRGGSIRDEYEMHQ